jgi:MFS family permease
MVGGILADIYVASERNTPMVIFVGMTLFGTGLGPLVSDFIAQNTSWRWVYYLQTLTCGLLIAAVALFFNETRGSILLSRKAKALNKWYEELEAAGYIGLLMPHAHVRSDKPNSLQRIRWKVKSDEDRATLAKMISISLTRPLHMLFTESVVFWFSLWVSFSWAILYLQFGAIPLVFRASHNFDLQQTGLVFVAVMVGGIASTILSIYQERLALRYFPEKVSATPEGRLFFACAESVLMPVGLFWFGWTSYADIHWIVPATAVAVATMGIFSIYLATFNYLADIYHKYASSAIAAQSMCRNLLGGAFPLVTVQMYNMLGFPGASSLLGGLAVVLTAVPWVLMLFGPKIRARSPFAREIMQ